MLAASCTDITIRPRTVVFPVSLNEYLMSKEMDFLNEKLFITQLSDAIESSGMKGRTC